MIEDKRKNLEEQFSPTIRFAKAFYNYFQFMTPPPPDLDAQCEALKKKITTRRLLAQQMIALCGECDDLECMGMICEACDWAGPSMADTTILWTKRLLDAAGDFNHMDAAVRKLVHNKALCMLARAYEAKAMWAEALVTYRQAFHLINSYGNSVHIADVLVNMGRFDEALACMEECNTLHIEHKAFLDIDVTWLPRNEKQRRGTDTYLRNIYKLIELKIDEI